MVDSLDVTIEQLIQAGFSDTDAGSDSQHIFMKNDNGREIRIIYHKSDDSRGRITSAYEICCSPDPKLSSQIPLLEIEGVLEGKYAIKEISKKREPFTGQSN